VRAVPIAEWGPSLTIQGRALCILAVKLEQISCSCEPDKWVSTVFPGKTAMNPFALGTPTGDSL